MQVQKTLQLPNQLSKLHHIRRAVRNFVLPNGNESFVTRMILAVDEALSNVIEHGFPEKRRSSIFLQMLKRPGEIKFSILDDGIPYDPNPGKRSLSPTGNQGYGLKIIHTLMDVKYTHRPEGINILELSKKLDSTP